MGALETQNTSGAARHALAAGQAMAVFDRFSQPGVAADVNIDGAVI